MSAKACHGSYKYGGGYKYVHQPTQVVYVVEQPPPSTVVVGGGHGGHSTGHGSKLKDKIKEKLGIQSAPAAAPQQTETKYYKVYKGKR